MVLNIAHHLYCIFISVDFLISYNTVDQALNKDEQCSVKDNNDYLSIYHITMVQDKVRPNASTNAADKHMYHYYQTKASQENGMINDDSNQTRTDSGAVLYFVLFCHINAKDNRLVYTSL